jgi:hypothetical protein
MAEPIRGESIRNEEPITTSDLAGMPGTYKNDPNLAAEAEAENRDPRGPQLVENDFALEDLRNESVNDTPEIHRAWETNRSTRDASNTGRQALDTTAPPFRETEVTDYQSRWSNVQAEFVDDPRRAVQEADQLVANVMQHLADGFAKERASLEKQWDSGDNVSTEDLRVALQRYRAFFGRLLNAA